MVLWPISQRGSFPRLWLPVGSTVIIRSGPNSLHIYDQYCHIVCDVIWALKVLCAKTTAQINAMGGRGVEYKGWGWVVLCYECKVLEHSVSCPQTLLAIQIAKAVTTNSIKFLWDI